MATRAWIHCSWFWFFIFLLLYCLIHSCDLDSYHLSTVIFIWHTLLWFIYFRLLIDVFLGHFQHLVWFLHLFHSTLPSSKKLHRHHLCTTKRVFSSCHGRKCLWCLDVWKPLCVLGQFCVVPACLCICFELLSFPCSSEQHHSGFPPWITDSCHCSGSSMGSVLLSRKHNDMSPLNLTRRTPATPSCRDPHGNASLSSSNNSGSCKGSDCSPTKGWVPSRV